MMNPSSVEGMQPATATASSVIIPRNKQRVRPIPGKKQTQHRAAIKSRAARPFIGPSHSPSPSSSSTKTRDWSQDPLECPHSDWTIHILARRQPKFKVFNNHGAKDTYYISTHALKKLAPHRVPLFERILFECLEETGEAESRLIIEDQTVAQGFGVLLDLLYAKTEDEESELLSSVKNARALYRIAEYFEARPLQEKVASFYEKATKEFANPPTTITNNTAAAQTSTKTPKGHRVLEPPSVNSTRSGAFPTNSHKEMRINSHPASVTGGQDSSVMAVCSDKASSRYSPRPDPILFMANGSNRRHVKTDPETSLQYAAPASVVSMTSSLGFSWTGKSKRDKSKPERRQEKPQQRIKQGSLLEKRTQESPTMEHEAMEPTALLQVLKQKRALGADFSRLDSENFSCLIALCIQQNRDKIDRTMFYKLTSKEYMPNVDPEAALQLLILEVELDFWNEPNKFSSLQSRCIRSILANWEVSRTKYPSDEHFWKALKKLSPGVLAILLMHTSGTHHGDDGFSQDQYS